jgi:hypothetical protein
VSGQPDEHSEDLIDACIRRLVEGRDAPGLGGIHADERARLEATFRLLDAVAGIDPDLVPPLEADPVARALGFTPAVATVAPALPAEDVPARIAREVERLRRGALVLPDEEAAELPDARSDLLVRVAGLRIRVVVAAPEELAHPAELLREADRLFFRFPETAAVALVADDADLSCLVVEPQDCRPALEAPAGRRAGPRPRRQRLSLGAALASYLDEVEPVWEEPGMLTDGPDRDFDVAVVAAETAAAVVRRLKDEASRARIPAKALAYAALGEYETEELARLVMDVAEGRLAGEQVGERIARLVRSAA